MSMPSPTLFSPAKTRISLAAGLLAFVAYGCECDPDVFEIAPRLAVDVCADPEVIVDGVLLGGVRDCKLDFGDADISVRVEKEIRVANPTAVPLVIKLVDFDENSDPAYKVEQAPERVGEGLTSIITVSFRPNVESSVQGTLLIDSDAQNIEPVEGDDGKKHRWVEIPVVGNGVDNGIPDIAIDPPECDFGRVAVDGIAQCQLTVRNEGSKDLILDEVTIQDGVTVPAESTSEEPFGFFGRPPSPEDAIAPGSSATISMRFAPEALGEYLGNMIVLSNDPDELETNVALKGVGVTPPTACCCVKSINGEPVDCPDACGPSPHQPPTEVEPLDDIVLTGEASQAAAGGGSVTGYTWEIINQPPGSTARLANPAGAETGFLFADGRPGLDIAGTYEVKLTVTDDLGTTSTNECTVQWDAIPTDTIHVGLVWDTDYGDMDLHMIKKDDSDRYCGTTAILGPVAESCSDTGTDNVCYFGNCKPTSFGNPPDWDGTPGRTDGDPVLDIDDLSGYGPENINIDQAVAGSYLIGVDHYSGAGGTGCTLRLYLYGQLQAEWYMVLDDSDWWEVAIVHWPGATGGAFCIEDLTTAAEECPGM
jgi:hypothetical protein